MPRRAKARKSAASHRRRCAPRLDPLAGAGVSFLSFTEKRGLLEESLVVEKKTIVRDYRAIARAQGPSR